MISARKTLQKRDQELLDAHLATKEIVYWRRELAAKYREGERVKRREARFKS